MVHSWREVEVALGSAGKKKDLKRARKLLLSAGASPSTSRTKLDRALAPAFPGGQVSTVDTAAIKYVVKGKRKAEKRLGKADDDIEELHRARVRRRSWHDTRQSWSNPPTAA